MARIRVYVDAFNVYYGALKNRGPGTKWLDIRALVGAVLPKHVVERVVYCTARVSDPDATQRQDRYLRALTATGVELVEGTYKLRQKRGDLIDPPPPPGFPARVTIRTPEEKGSDVNIASRLLVDAYEDLFEEAVVMSLDTDLAWPIHHVAHNLKKPVGILFNKDRGNGTGAPTPITLATVLRRAAKYSRGYTEAQVRASQLPNPVVVGEIRIPKPTGW